jgi:hypothetical protein
VRASIIAIAVGVVLFVLPMPGTFVAGGLVLLAGVIARLLGSQALGLVVRRLPGTFVWDSRRYG